MPSALRVNTVMPQRSSNRRRRLLAAETATGILAAALLRLPVVAIAVSRRKSERSKCTWRSLMAKASFVKMRFFGIYVLFRITPVSIPLLGCP
ncbi:hypothetical protein D9M71_646390 [compost metagenome]